MYMNLHTHVNFLLYANLYANFYFGLIIGEIKF